MHFHLIAANLPSFNQDADVIGIFLDTETNGLSSSKHKILEIAYKLIDVETGALIDAFSSLVAIDESSWKQSDPESLKINGFSWQEITQGKAEKEVASLIVANFDHHRIQRGQAVFICQNPSFDRAFFSQLIPSELQEQKRWPYHWLDLASMFWAMCIKEQRERGCPSPWRVGCSKDAIAAFYGIAAEKKPHRAMNGVDHLIACYEAVVGFASNSSVT